jgi:hypothetical protein
MNFANAITFAMPFFDPLPFPRCAENKTARLIFASAMADDPSSTTNKQHWFACNARQPFGYAAE